MKRSVLFVLAALFVASCGNIGGGETLIKGDDNVIVQGDSTERLAAVLASFEATPYVTDEDLAAVYEMVHAGALAGDLDSALVLLEVAKIQRTPVE